jgi:hypothetical protein
MDEEGGIAEGCEVVVEVFNRRRSVNRGWGVDNVEERWVSYGNGYGGATAWSTFR